MRYAVQFANSRVAEVPVAPFDVEVPEHLGTVEQTAELQRKIRERLCAALVNAPALAGMATSADVAAYTNVLADLRDQQGVVYYGTSTIGHMTIYPMP